MSEVLPDLPRPFFSSDDRDAVRSSAKLLLITFHFPPDPAVGGLRWQQFAKFIVARGWALDVITGDPAALPLRDDGRLAQLPPGVRVFAVPAERTRAGRTLRWMSAVLRRRVRGGRGAQPVASTIWSGSMRREDVARQSFRDRAARGYSALLANWEARFWARRAARIGKSLVHATDGSYRAVLTSGPPHMAHEAGRLVAASANVPLVVDFRDPWSLVERVAGEKASPVWFALAERDERRVVRQASVIAMNTEPAAEAMRARYPEVGERIVAIWNGTDDERTPLTEPNHRFTIRFAGEIYIDRDPRLVFRAAGAVVARLGLTPREFGLLFIGDVAQFNGVPLEEIAAREGLVGFVETGPVRPRRDALKFLAAGSMLLSLPQDSDLAVPAKIFEYMSFSAWLLILARRGSATERLLRGSGADVVDPGDLERLTQVIGDRFEQHRRGERPTPVAGDGRYSRRLQAEALLGRIEQVVGR